MRGKISAALAALALWISAVPGSANAAPAASDAVEKRDEFVLGNVIFILFH